MLNPLIKIEACKFDKCPVLLVHPQRDNWTGLSLSQLFFNELRCEKELKLLDCLSHSRIISDSFMVSFLQNTKFLYCPHLSY
ncbi:MAG: lysophospholipase [Bacillota bacterium]|jgi:alpha-beta hydrolase superfamily lysophospholipase|nr:lysophospholipase [Bacillota bacterium]